MNAERVAKAARKSILDAIYKSKSSHIGSCYSCVDIISVIYCEIFDINSIKSNAKDRDYFILSKGHAAAALYSVLKAVGFQIDLDNYGANWSNLMTHASSRVDGVEVSSGSLGLGLGHGVGRAIHYLRSGYNGKIITLLSDGEMNEGSNWEAIMMASHLKLKNLIFVIDKNNLQSLTTTKETLDLGSLVDKLSQFDLKVIELDGHDHIELCKAFIEKTDRAKVIVANTVKGKGVSFMENKVEWHYRPPNDEEYLSATVELKNA